MEVQILLLQLKRIKCVVTSRKLAPTTLFKCYPKGKRTGMRLVLSNSIPKVELLIERLAYFGYLFIIIVMACHCLHLKNASEFYTLLKQRDPDLIKKMVKCVMSAYKRNKADIDIFDITFKDMSELTFNIERSQYSELLSNCLKDMIEIEEYELCAEIKKVIDKKSKHGDGIGI